MTRHIEFIITEFLCQFFYKNSYLRWGQPNANSTSFLVGLNFDLCPSTRRVIALGKAFLDQRNTPTMHALLQNLLK